MATPVTASSVFWEANGYHQRVLRGKKHTDATFGLPRGITRPRTAPRTTPMTPMTDLTLSYEYIAALIGIICLENP